MEHSTKPSPETTPVDIEMSDANKPHKKQSDPKNSQSQTIKSGIADLLSLQTNIFKQSTVEAEAILQTFCKTIGMVQVTDP